MAGRIRSGKMSRPRPKGDTTARKQRVDRGTVGWSYLYPRPEYKTSWEGDYNAR